MLFRLLNHHHTLKMRINFAGLHVRPNCYISEIKFSMFWMINACKSLVEKVIEGFVYLICLTEYDSMTKNC